MRITLSIAISLEILCGIVKQQGWVEKTFQIKFLRFGMLLAETA